MMGVRVYLLRVQVNLKTKWRRESARHTSKNMQRENNIVKIAKGRRAADFHRR